MRTKELLSTLLELEAEESGCADSPGFKLGYLLSLVDSHHSYAALLHVRTKILKRDAEADKSVRAPLHEKGGEA